MIALLILAALLIVPASMRAADSVPVIRVGHGTIRDGRATVQIDVGTGGYRLVTLAPLRVRYDATKLSFRRCTSASGLALWAIESPIGQVNLVAYRMTPWPRHIVVALCEFSASAAPAALVPITPTGASLSTDTLDEPVPLLVTGSVLIP